MKRKWIKRSDRILMAMVIMWFIGAFWGMAMEMASFALQVLYAMRTLQTSSGGYYGYGGMNLSLDINSVLLYIGAPVTGGLMTWLIKNMVEATTANKLNPEYLKTHLPENDYDVP